mgnify:CR=1 FL=1
MRLRGPLLVLHTPRSSLAHFMPTVGTVHLDTLSLRPHVRLAGVVFAPDRKEPTVATTYKLQVLLPDAVGRMLEDMAERAFVPKRYVLARIISEAHAAETGAKAPAHSGHFDEEGNPLA